MTLPRWLDLPPVWLLACLGLARVQAAFLPTSVSLSNPVTQLLAGLLVGGGILLMILAIAAFQRHRTTFIPHQMPETMITDGIFRFGRNPIYLGDTMVLTGFILWWDAVPALVLIPMFMLIITARFIKPEEARLAEKFGAAFDQYAQTTRRWL